MPQPLGSFGGQLGTGTALVLATLTVALAEDALAQVVAIAPVTARAMTRLRTMIFMIGSLLVTQSGRNENFLLDKSNKMIIRYKLL
jgi:hypothetical protein